MKKWNKDVLLRTSVLAGMALALSAGAVAQESTDADEDDAPAAQTQDRILVTGSRIARAGVDTVYPAISVDRATIDNRAFTNLADALREVPSFAPGVNPDGPQNTFATGQNFANFLGLGTQRTLTLVNGRRFVSSNVPNTFGATGGLQVDFNVIPTVLVERLETIGVGGAPIYGSDAIAGTINVILRDDFEGLEFGAQVGTTERGHGENYQAQIVAGGNWAGGRGNTVMSIEWQNQNGMQRSARPDLYGLGDRPSWVSDGSLRRDVTGDGVLNTVNRRTSDRVINLFTLGGTISPGFQFIGDGRAGRLPNGTLYQFSPESTLVPYQSGTRDPASAFFAEGGDGYDLFTFANQIRSPLERLVIYSQTRYDITDNITFRMDMQAANTQASDLGNQGGFQTWAFGGNSGPVRHFRDPVRGWNPFLPAQAQAVLDSNGLTSFYQHRFLNDLLYNGQRDSEQSLIRVTGGFDGSFDLAGRTWDWDVSAVYGSADIENRGFMVNQQRYANALDAIRLTAADLARVNANPAAAQNAILARSGTTRAGVGDIVCRSVWQRALPASDPDALPAFGGVSNGNINVPASANNPFVDGCVPLNMFGANAFSAEAQDFVVGQQITSSDLEQSSFLATVGGELFDVWAGAVAVNVGFEARREQAAFVAGEADRIGLGRSASFLNTGGRYSTTEYFGEILVPLLSADMNIPLVNFAEFSGAFRRIENTLAGDADVFTVGGRYSPFEDVVFRANYTESLRAPSLVELFAPQTTSFSFAADPCDNRNVNTGPNPATRRANCVAELGAGYNPDTFVSNIVNATAVGRTGGNPALENEVAESFSVGMTWEPSFSILDGLLVTVDYINIEIFEAITVVTLSQLMRACYDSGAFPNPACNSFTRDGGGQVIDFLTGQANAATLRAESINGTVSYGFDVASAMGRFMDTNGADYGDLTLSSRINRTLTRETSVVGEPSQRSIGGYADPKWQATFDANWSYGNWNAFWRVNWRDAVLVSPANLSFSCVSNCSATSGDYRLDSGDRWIHNASISYVFGQPFAGAPQNTIVQFNVNNVFDRQPDDFQLGHGHFGIDEQLGRNFVFRLRAQY